MRRYCAILIPGCQRPTLMSQKSNGVWYWYGGDIPFTDHPVTPEMILKDYGEKLDHEYDEPYAQVVRDFPPKPELSNSLGWLAPDGKFYPCEYAEHTSLAEELIILYYPNGDPGDDDELVDRGWRRVTVSGVYPYPGDTPFSQAQYDTLFDLSQIASGDVLKGIEGWLKRARQFFPG